MLRAHTHTHASSLFCASLCCTDIHILWINTQYSSNSNSNNSVVCTENENYDIISCKILFLLFFVLRQWCSSFTTSCSLFPVVCVCPLYLCLAASYSTNWVSECVLELAALYYAAILLLHHSTIVLTWLCWNLFQNILCFAAMAFYLVILSRFFLPFHAAL